MVELERDVRPRPDRLVQGVAGDRGLQHAAPGVRAGARTAPSPPSRSSRRRRPSHPTLRAHRIGDRPVRPRRRRADATATASRSTSSGPRRRCPSSSGVKQPDLLLLNDDDLTFAKIRLDERSLATVTSHLARLDSSLARALCWSAAWDMTRDAEMAPSAFVELVANGIGTEDNIVTVQITLRQAQSVIDLYARPEHRDAIRTRLAELLARARPAAPAGSDHQLALLRAFAGVSTEDADLELLGRLLDGTEILEGLAVDADLRWHLLHRLVVRGKRADAGDRGRAGTRRDVGRAAARRGRPGGPTDGGGEGRGLVEARRPRRAPERTADGDDRRVHGARPARAAPARTSSGTSPRSARSGTRAPRRWPPTS